MAATHGQVFPTHQQDSGPTRGGVAQGLEPIVAGPPNRGLYVGGQRQFAHSRRGDAGDDAVTSIGHGCSTACDRNLFFVLDHPLGQHQWGDVGQRPGGENLCQPLSEPRWGQVQFGAQEPPGQSEAGHPIGDAGEPFHRLDAGDGSFLSGVLKAAPDEEDGVVRGNEQGCRAHGASVV